jgi:hypothetical protein
LPQDFIKLSPVFLHRFTPASQRFVAQIDGNICPTRTVEAAFRICNIAARRTSEFMDAARAHKEFSDTNDQVK